MVNLSSKLLALAALFAGGVHAQSAEPELAPIVSLKNQYESALASPREFP